SLRHILFLLSTIRPRPSSTLFPYTTLFRSRRRGCGRHARLQRPGRLHPIPPLALGFHQRAVGLRRQVLDAPAGVRDGRDPEAGRSEEHTSELQSRENLVCRLLLEKKKKDNN